MDTGDGWNQTLTQFAYNGQTIVQQYDLVSVMFELGYPYIGMSERFFDQLSSALRADINNVECTKGEHWGLCRVANKACDSLNLNQNLTFTMNGIEFSTPLENIAV